MILGLGLLSPFGVSGTPDLVSLHARIFCLAQVGTALAKLMWTRASLPIWGLEPP